MSFRYVPNKNLGALVELPYHSLVQLNLKGVSWALTQNSELDKLTQEETKKKKTPLFTSSQLVLSELRESPKPEMTLSSPRCHCWVHLCKESKHSPSSFPWFLVFTRLNLMLLLPLPLYRLITQCLADWPIPVIWLISVWFVLLLLFVFLNIRHNKTYSNPHKYNIRWKIIKTE